MATNPAQAVVTSTQVNKRPRQNDDNGDPQNAAYEPDGANHFRQAKKRRLRRAQFAKPLIRPRRTISPSPTDSEGTNSSSVSSDTPRKRKAVTHTPKRSKQPVSPPLSPKATHWLPDFQLPLSGNITPASLRDYMMSDRYLDCFLGEEVNDIILGEYQAAESRNLRME